MRGKERALTALAAHQARIAEAQALLRALEAEALPKVVAALNEGATWVQVGEAVAQSAQNAHRRFDKHLLKDVQRRYSVKTDSKP